MALVYIYSPREEGERRTHWTRTDFSAHQSKSLNKRRNSSTYTKDSSKAADKQPVKKCKMTTQM